jgi:uncharacterized protein with PIN domain
MWPAPRPKDPRDSEKQLAAVSRSATMEELRSEYPVCDRCELTLRTVQDIPAPEGTITVYRCPNCSRQFWKSTPKK